LRHVDEFLSASAVRELATFIKSDTVPSFRAAIVVDQDVHFGLTRMFEMLSEQPGVEKRVFRDYDQAREWLTQPWPIVEVPGSDIQHRRTPS
jgi:hypothetical protein